MRYCLGFMFDVNTNLVLMIKKNRPEWQKYQWNGIGGKVEENEFPEAAMAREFKEETGLITTPDSWELYCVLSGDKGDIIKHRWEMFCYRAVGDTTNFSKVCDEGVVSLLDPLSLPHNTVKSARWLVSMADYSWDSPVTAIAAFDNDYLR